MTVDHYNSGALAPRPDQAPVAHNTQVADMQQWAAQAQSAFQIAEMICGTEFCPQQFRGKPHAAAAAMLAGGELGFSPMTSLNAFDVIQGATSLKAKTMLAIVQSRGHFTRFVEKGPTRVVMEGHRKGQPESMQTVEWTIERADKAGYVKKNPNYNSKPQEMLVARAQAELCRAIASDALLGIPYSTEELQDDPNIFEPHPDQQAATPPSRAVRGKTQTTADALTGTTPVEPVADVSGGEPMVTKAQLTRLGATFTEAGVTDRAARLRIVASLSDRNVASSNELTKAEATALIDHLAELGTDGIAALANPTADNETGQWEADPASDPWAGEQGTLGGDQ